MFGFGDKGTTNLMTRALASVGKRLETVPDPTQIHYHLPAGPRHPQARCPMPLPWLLPDGCARGRLCQGREFLALLQCRSHPLNRLLWLLHPALPAWLPPCLQGWQVKVWRDYEQFIAELTSKFPHEREGIRKLYDEFWKVGAAARL
jgi:prolycopene isomerase